MAEAKRVRLEPDIEEYLKSQSERVLSKSEVQLTGADYSTLTNRIIYEHKLAQGMALKIPFRELLSWLTSWVPSSSSKVVPLAQSSADAPALKPQDSFEFDADLGDLYEQTEAA